MSGAYPAAILIKMIKDNSDQGISVAAREFEEAMRAGFPSFSLGEWSPPSFNDLREGAAGIYLDRLDERILFSFRGTRQTRAGAYLMSQFDFKCDRYWKSRAYDLEFLREVVRSKDAGSGLIMMGQTHADGVFGQFSGLRSDVFAFLLGVRARLSFAFLAPGDETPAIFPCAELASSLRAVLKPDVVSVGGRNSGKFLRRCFKELSGSITKTDFNERYGSFGIFWRPRSLTQVIRHPL